MADDRPERELYERDFYAWTQVQAEALRSGVAGSNAVDWERVAEEIESLGASERSTVEGHLLQIAVHLYKLRNSSARPPRPKWRAEVRQHRLQAEDRLTPSIRHDLEGSWSDCTGGRPARRSAASTTMSGTSALKAPPAGLCPSCWARPTIRSRR